MNRQEKLDFNSIAKVIEFVRNNKQQLNLNSIAQEVGLSPTDFQQLFTSWAGVSSEIFFKYITTEYTKKALKENSLLITSHKPSSQPNNLVINIEGMTQNEYKNNGENLNINYSFTESLFGDVIIATTTKGVCYMAFADDRTAAFSALKEKFSNAKYNQTIDDMQKCVLSILTQDLGSQVKINLHLKGTDFQLKVWNALLEIPKSTLTTYRDIATKICSCNASRAVGTAIGENPVSLIIPCHRVIRSSGELGGYHWGLTRKVAIIGWEATHNDATKHR